MNSFGASIGVDSFVDSTGRVSAGAPPYFVFANVSRMAPAEGDTTPRRIEIQRDLLKPRFRPIDPALIIGHELSHYISGIVGPADACDPIDYAQ